MSSSNPSFPQFGVDAMSGHFMASNRGMLGADVPPFHPSMPPPDHGGFGGLGLCFGDAAAGGDASSADIGSQFAANNLMLASLASQLFASAPQLHGGARTPPDEEMDGGYDVAGVGSSEAASFTCHGLSDANAVSVWSSSRKPYSHWSNADGPRTASVHGSYQLAGEPDATGLHYPLAAGHSVAAPSELSLSLCYRSSPGSMVSATGQFSSEASRSGLTYISRAAESDLQQVYYPQVRSRPAHFSVVVACSRYAPVAQQVLNDAVGRVLHDVSADSVSGVDSGTTRPSWQASSSSVSSSNQFMASPEQHAHGGDADAPWGEAHRVRSELMKMLQLMDQKYNQCLDEIQSTTAKFNSLMMQSGSSIGGGNGSICAPFAHRAVSSLYRSLRRRITGEITAAASGRTRPSRAESSSVTAARERERSWESSLIQKHWAAHQLRRAEQQPCWRPQRGLPEKSVAVLKAWMFQNFLRPYPNDGEKDMLAARSGLTRSQVSNWFINARVRLWKPMIEEMYEELKQSSSGGEGPAMEHLSSQRAVS